MTRLKLDLCRASDLMVNASESEILDMVVQDLVSVDFFTVPTVSFRVLFVFVVLAHHRRRIVHNVAEHPTAGWTGQQMVEAFPEDTAPRYLLRDRDKIYGVSSRNESEA